MKPSETNVFIEHFSFGFLKYEVVGEFLNTVHQSTVRSFNTVLHLLTVTDTVTSGTIHPDRSTALILKKLGKRVC